MCPWNRFAPPAHEARLHARALEGWTLERLLALDGPGFIVLFAGSPIRRAGRAGLLRNVCVALGNRSDRRSIPALARAAVEDPDPVVRGHACWALGEIGARLDPRAPERMELAAALERALGDPAAEVREEARLAGGDLERAGGLRPATSP